MKKKIASLLMVFIAMFVFAGCSPDAKAYLEDVEKSTWEKASCNGNMNLSFKDNEGNSFSIPLNVKVDCVSPNTQPLLHYSVTFGQITAVGSNDTDQSALTALSGKTMEYYYDSKNEKMLMNKSLLIEMMEASGERIPNELKNLKEDFLGIDLTDLSFGVTGTDYSAIAFRGQDKIKELSGLFEKFFSDFNHKAMDISKNGNSYHYEVSGADLVDGSVAALKHLIKNWPKLKTELMPILKEMQIPLTTNDIVKLEKDLKNAEKGLPEFKKSIEGSKISCDVTFNKDSYVTKGNVAIKAKGFFNINYDFDLTTTKNDSLNITIPSNTRYLGTEEFFNLMRPQIAVGNEVLVEVNDKLLDDRGFATKDGRTLVPYRAFAEQIGATVGYDAKTKNVKVTKDKKTIVLTLNKKEAMIDGKKVMLDAVTVVRDSKTYVPLRFLGENYGYKVSWDQKNRVASLNKEVA